MVVQTAKSNTAESNTAESNNSVQTNNSVQSATSNESQILSEIKKFTISKDEKGSFGINIIGGVDQPYIPGCNGIFICKIRRKDLDDGIKEGDRIIAVNDTELDGKSHAEVVKLLKEAGESCVFTIETDAERKIVAATSSDVLVGHFGSERRDGSLIPNIFAASPTLSEQHDGIMDDVSFHTAAGDETFDRNSLSPSEQGDIETSSRSIFNSIVSKLNFYSAPPLVQLTIGTSGGIVTGYLFGKNVTCYLFSRTNKFVAAFMGGTLLIIQGYQMTLPFGGHFMKKEGDLDGAQMENEKRDERVHTLGPQKEPDVRNVGPPKRVNNNGNGKSNKFLARHMHLFGGFVTGLLIGFGLSPTTGGI